MEVVFSRILGRYSYPLSGHTSAPGRAKPDRRLGWRIKRHAGRIVNGQRFVRASGNRSAEAWRVESVSPVSSKPSEPSVSDVVNDRCAYAHASRGE